MSKIEFLESRFLEVKKQLDRFKKQGAQTADNLQERYMLALELNMLAKAIRAEGAHNG